MMKRVFVVLWRVICVASLALNVVVFSLAVLWYMDRATPNGVSADQMHRLIRETSWNSAGEWRVVARDADAIVVEYRLPYFDFHRYRLPANEFRMSRQAQGKPVPFTLAYDGCEVMRYSREAGTFVCMPFRDLRKD